MRPRSQIKRLTETEYLAIDRSAACKSEFFDGEMFAMAGGSPMHSLIAANLIGGLRNALKGRDCLTFTSDLRVKAEMTGLNTYPDLTVVCGEMRFSDADRETLVNPTLVAEVLSDATEGYDRGEKFEHYRRIATLRAYLLASQRKPSLELFLRNDAGQWLLSEAAGLEASLGIPSLGITLSLDEVFANVTFPKTGPRESIASA